MIRVCPLIPVHQSLSPNCLHSYSICLQRDVFFDIMLVYIALFYQHMIQPIKFGPGDRFSAFEIRSLFSVAVIININIPFYLYRFLHPSSSILRNFKIEKKNLLRVIVLLSILDDVRMM